MHCIYYYPYFKGKKTESGRLRNLLKVTELVIRGASSHTQVCEISETVLNTIPWIFVTLESVKAPIL